MAVHAKATVQLLSSGYEKGLENISSLRDVQRKVSVAGAASLMHGRFTYEPNDHEVDVSYFPRGGPHMALFDVLPRYNLF